MNPAMSVVLSKAANLSFRTEVCDERTLYIDGRPCQGIKSKWFENRQGCRALTIYMPRNGFADFLLYVPEGQGSVYVVPRGKIAYDTAWAESGLEPYKEAWHLLKETTPLLFERKAEALSGQLRRIIAEAKKRNLPYELIPSKRSVSRFDYRTYKQRRILINGKRCAVFTASLLPNHDQNWDGAVFKVPKDSWAEILLYILNEDIYVVPRDQMPHETSLSLDSTRIYDYRNAWCAVDDRRGTKPEAGDTDGVSCSDRTQKTDEAGRTKL